MKADDIFSISNPDAYLSSVMSVGKVSAYMCQLCGSFVARDYLVKHADMHDNMENSVTFKNSKRG